MKERLYKIEQLAVILDVSVKTINNWYWYKRENSDDELAKLLPDYIQESARSTRYWKESDIEQLIKFKLAVPKGRYGVMGSITQRYYKKIGECHENK